MEKKTCWKMAPFAQPNLGATTRNSETLTKSKSVNNTSDLPTKTVTTVTILVNGQARCDTLKSPKHHAKGRRPRPNKRQDCEAT